jgi:hypothetical protein
MKEVIATAILFRKPEDELPELLPGNSVDFGLILSTFERYVANLD